MNSLNHCKLVANITGNLIELEHSMLGNSPRIQFCRKLAKNLETIRKESGVFNRDNSTKTFRNFYCVWGWSAITLMYNRVDRFRTSLEWLKCTSENSIYGLNKKYPLQDFDFGSQLSLPPCFSKFEKMHTFMYFFSCLVFLMEWKQVHHNEVNTMGFLK